MRIKLRRAIGWVAACTLALQTVLGGLLLLPLASADAALAFDPAAIICLSGGGPGHTAARRMNCPQAPGAR
jgi:hypothetical protein